MPDARDGKDNPLPAAAEAASLNPAALGGGLSPVILATWAALRASQQQEVERLTKSVSKLRRKLRREPRRRSRGASAAVASPSVTETIDRTARTIYDTCQKIAKVVEELPPARARKRAPRKRKNSETTKSGKSSNDATSA